MDKVKCAAKSKTTGSRCGNSPAPGATTCRFHGGASPQAKSAAERRLQAAQAMAAVTTFGLPREIDPRDALLEEVYRTSGAVDWLATKVRELADDAVVWGKTEESADDVKHKAAPSVWVQLYQTERTHLVRVAREAIAAGIEERKVRLAEQQGAMLASVIKAVLADLDLTSEQQARVPEVVPRHLRAVA